MELVARNPFLRSVCRNKNHAFSLTIQTRIRETVRHLGNCVPNYTASRANNVNSKRR